MKLLENTGIRECVLEEIRNLAQQHEIEKVILFGSRARGDFYKTSDIDIASSGGNFVRFSLEVEEDTSTLLQYDTVNLDGAVSEELRDAINREGRILYEKV